MKVWALLPRVSLKWDSTSTHKYRKIKEKPYLLIYLEYVTHTLLYFNITEQYSNFVAQSKLFYILT